jgi:hypothetical protein
VRPRFIAGVALAAAAVAGFVWWRRRGGAQPGSLQVQFGYSDGGGRVLGAADPAAAELRSMAQDVRAAMTERP